MLGLMAAGETAGVALGAHLGDSGRGSLGADLGASVGSLVLGVFVAGAATALSGGEAAALLVPVAQIGVVVLVERGTAQARARRTP